MRNWPEVINVMTTRRRHERAKSPRGRATSRRGASMSGWSTWMIEEGPENRQRFSQFEIMARARKILADYPDLRSSVQIPAAISSGTVNADVEMTLVGPDLNKLGEYADEMIAKLRRNPGLADVDTTLALRKPEAADYSQPRAASDLGVNIQSIASTVQTLVGGQIVSDFKDNQLGELYDVWLRAVGIDRNDRRGIENLRSRRARRSTTRRATPIPGLLPIRRTRS